MKYRVFCLISTLLLLFVMSVAVSGQQVFSTIVGLVSDPSGATVPDAQITVTNIDTGISVQRQSASAGTYSVGELQPGNYKVEVSKVGFETIQETGITLLAGQTVRVDVQLRVGASKQIVSVTGSAPLVHTDTQSIQASVPTRLIDDIPKSMQSIDTLLALVPGSSYAANNAQIAGSTYWGGDDWSLNGTSVQDATNGRAQNSTVGEVSLPSTNALQEFKLDSVALNAEFRQPTGITMVLKQGTNSLHGEAYGYFENRDLNANAFLSNAEGIPKAAYDRDQYGGLIGGPIIKNKLFFFVDYFHFRQVAPTIVTQTFPSAAMRGGDFGAICKTFSTGGLCTSGTQLYNPTTGAAFPYNNIGNTFSSSVSTILGYLPLPNDTVSSNLAGLPGGGPNYTGAIPNIFSKNSWDGRIDWTVSPKDTVNGFFRYMTSPKWFYSGGSTPVYNNYANYRDFDHTISLTEVHSFGGTAVNEFHGTWGNYEQERQGQNPQILPWTIVSGMPVQATYGLPTITATGYSGLPADYGGGQGFPMYTVEFGDNFTKTKGKHTIKAGFLESAYKFSVPDRDGALTGLLGSYNGAFAFTGSFTGGKGFYSTKSGCSPCASNGNAFADFLLGDISSDNYAQLINSSQFTSRDSEFYVQDSWQVNPRLTLNYGLRYQYQSMWQVRDLAYTPFDLANDKLMLLQSGSTPVNPPTGYANLLAAYPFETSSSVGINPTKYYQPNTGNWGPRFGFAWRPFGGTRTVIRGGYGFYYSFIPSELGSIVMTFNPPFNNAASYATNLPGTPRAGGFTPDLTFANAFPTGGAHAPTSNPQLYTSPRNVMSDRLEQWALTVEHQYGQQWMTRITYLGQQIQHLAGEDININMPNVQVPNATLQSQRPFQPWGGINYNLPPSGIQNYGQLQLELVKHFSSGFSLQVEYNWTHSLDNVTVANPFNNPWCQKCEYGTSQYMPLQRLVFSYTYELPFGSGRHWLNQRGVVNQVIGGWELAGITGYVGGAPTATSVTFNVPSAVVGWWGGRSDRIAGVPLYAKAAGHNVISSGSYSGLNYINQAAFAPPPEWTYGNSARDLIIPPGTENWDMTLLKNFDIHKESMRLQVRTDWLDAFNHCNLGTPGLVQGDTRDGGTAVASFGVINSCAATISGESGTGRVIQLGIRLLF